MMYCLSSLTVADDKDSWRRARRASSGFGKAHALGARDDRSHSGVRAADSRDAPNGLLL